MFTSVTIYLDNNATTRLAGPVREAMAPFFDEDYANPASPYGPAQRSLAAVTRARDEAATLIGSTPAEIVFTSGGTESNNAVLASVSARPGARVLVSAVEHPSVGETAQALAARGCRVKTVPVHIDGTIDVTTYSSILTEGWDLVSLMTANNETGVLFPVAALAALAHEAGALFHTDAVQAAGKIPIDVKECDVDFLSLSAHKLHGPKGVGLLYIKEGTSYEPLLIGGGQERHRRAGTLNVPGIVGFGRAAALATEALPDVNTRIRGLRDHLETGLLARLSGLTILGSATQRLPNTSDISVAGVAVEALLARLDLAGVCCSAGSACMAGSPEPSPVLTSMGLPADLVRGALRLSLSRLTTTAEIDEVLRILPDQVNTLRRTP